MSIFFTLSIILLGGFLLSLLCKKIHLPALVGYLLLGISLSLLENHFGSDSFHFMASELSNISSYIRKIALIIILSKAGLSLNISDLKKVGRPAILMSFLPACVEMVSVGIFAPMILPLSYTDSFLLGSVLGAVSPAVVVPMMSKLMDEKRGTEKGVPQLIIAGSSIDDIIMIVFYQAFLTMEKGESLSFMTFMNIPISILLGIGAGIALGFLLVLLFDKVHIRDTLKLILIFGIGFLLTYVEDVLYPYFGFSSLLAIISMCILIRNRKSEVSARLAKRNNQMWVMAEMFLFVLVGASINMDYALPYLLPALAILAISLSFRSSAVCLSLIKTKLNIKERGFTVISYLPKATVQAAIGGGLLDYGNLLLSQNATNANIVIASGMIVLSVSVVSILLTAPIAATTMNLTYTHLLHDDSLSISKEPKTEN